MKTKILFLLSVLFFLKAQAQQSEICGVHNVSTPESRMIENLTQARIASNSSSRSTIQIPIVFHVLYNATAENIPDAQITAQLNFTGDDYRRLNADTINTPTSFQSVAADAQITFCLAQQDPQGNATNGITRTFTDSLTFHAGPMSGDHMKYAVSGGVDAWDTHNYLNIWIVNLTGASGFSSNPMSHGSSFDGIVMNYMNINGTHLFSHEIGHYLNLIHVYGNEIPACESHDGGDQVNDTPDQAWSTFGCPTFPQTDSCTSISPGIMFMNFMDQTSSSCQNLFTQGQVTRMQDCVNNVRTSLLSSIGCLPSGMISVNGLKSENHLNIFPNPVTDILFVQGLSINSKIEIQNVTGQILFSETVNENATIDLSKFAEGIYILKTENGMKKIVKL